MAFVIITDSASDVSKDLIQAYGLHVIPTPVTIDGKDYFDGDTIFPEQLKHIILISLCFMRIFYLMPKEGMRFFIFVFQQELQEHLMQLLWLIRKF